MTDPTEIVRRMRADGVIPPMFHGATDEQLADMIRTIAQAKAENPNLEQDVEAVLKHRPATP